MDTVKLCNGVAVPFPVETPFAMRPNLRPWQKGEPLAIRDSLFDDYINEKKKYYGPVLGSDLDHSLLLRAIKSLQRYEPAVAHCAEQHDPVRALTMALQEDWVLLTPNQQGRLCAQILSVHFPSGWDPREKAGMTFSELHAPVADNGPILRAADALSTTIATKGPFIRHVWAIANTGTLNRRPDLVPERVDDDLGQMWFRCERQTTIPVDGIAALFLIRVFVAPLREIFQSPERKWAIIDSINSMTDAVLDYKGYRRLKQFLSTMPRT